MDIISYGIASKAAKQESYTRKEVLGLGVQGTSSHLKGRIDHIEKEIQSVVAQADKLIINNTINIMKAHAKLNAVAKSMKYKMHNMMFDDLLDLSGIDTAKSSGYTHDAINGLLKASKASSYMITTKIEPTDTVPNKVVLTVEERSEGANIANQAVITGIGGTFVSGRSLVDGDKTNYAWDDGSQTNQGVVFTYASPRKIQKVVVYSNNTYYLRGAELWVNGTKIASTTNNISSSNPWIIDLTPMDATEIKIIRPSGAYDQAISEIEIYESVTDIKGSYFLSRDGGNTFEPIQPETLFYFTAKSPADKQLVLKAELPANVQLLNYGLTWS